MTTKVIKGQKYRVSGHGLLFQNNTEVTAKTDANEVALVMDKNGEQQYVPVENLTKPFVAEVGTRVIVKSSTYYPNALTEAKVNAVGVVIRRPEKRNYWKQDIQVVRVKFSDGQDWTYRTTDVEVFDDSIGLGDAVEIIDSTCCPQELTKGKIGSRGTVTLVREPRGIPRPVNVRFSDGQEWAYNIDDVKKVCKVPLADGVEFGFNDHATAVSVKKFYKEYISLTITTNEVVNDDGEGNLVAKRSTQESSQFSLTYPEAKKLVGILQQMIDKK